MSLSSQIIRIMRTKKDETPSNYITTSLKLNNKSEQTKVRKRTRIGEGAKLDMSTRGSVNGTCSYYCSRCRRWYPRNASLNSDYHSRAQRHLTYGLRANIMSPIRSETSPIESDSENLGIERNVDTWGSRLNVNGQSQRDSTRHNMFARVHFKLNKCEDHRVFDIDEILNHEENNSVQANTSQLASSYSPQLVRPNESCNFGILDDVPMKANQDMSSRPPQSFRKLLNIKREDYCDFTNTNKCIKAYRSGLRNIGSSESQSKSCRPLNRRSPLKNIYSLASSSLILIVMMSSSYLESANATNYHWPLRKVHHSATGAPIDASPQTADVVNGPSPLKRHQLLIGQQYSNFSSIIPYTMVQDSDYGSMQDVSGHLMDADTANVESSEPQAISSKHLGHQQVQHPSRPDHHRPQTFLIHQIVSTDINDQILAPPQAPTQMQASEQTLSPSSSSSLIGRVASSDIIKKNDASDTSIVKSRALLSLSDSNRLILPHMQQIKSRFNQGCVGGTKCQFFALCWMSGGSLGASCGLLMTCCVTPSRHEIQPGFYGPVVNDPYCGRSTSKINRIVGGTDASFGQFPWQAFVQVGGSRCGGALISSRHVVTAGHCVARSQHSPSSIKVTLGDYILNSEIESIPHEVFSVVEVFLHPNFRFTPQADRYDVAVLELDRQASYKDNIKPICLPQKDAIFVGRVAYVAGWGALQAGSKLRPKVLQHVAVPVIENHVCEGWHRRKGIDIKIYDEMMCAGYELGQRDACQGDSGGPLMLNQFGVWYLVGIVSAGYSCAKQYQPGIYHRVSSSSDWISSNVYQQGVSK